MSPEQSPATVDMVMPMFSETMIEGTIVAWLKKLGEPIRFGEDLVEVETDKATMTYASDTSGVLVEILAEEGATLPVGSVIARVSQPHVSGPQPGSALPVRPEVTPAAPHEPPPQADRPEVRASPTAVTLAARLGVDLTGVTGTGPAGQIGRRDVEAAAATGGGASGRRSSISAPPTDAGKGTATLLALNALQRTAAQRLGESAARVPQFELSADLDVRAALALLAQLRSAGTTPIPTIGDLVVRLVAVALRDHPLLNASFRAHEQGVYLYSRRNIGVAVSTDRGLVVPTVLDADMKSLSEIAAATSQLAERARAGSLSPNELANGTFTVSNLGMYAIDRFTALINPPQTAILAVGAAQPRVVVGSSGTVETTTAMTVTLGCDHRAMQGTDAARFLTRLRELFADPTPHLVHE